MSTKNIVQEVKAMLAAAFQESQPVVIEGKTYPHGIFLAAYENQPHPLGESSSPAQEFADRNGMPEIMGDYKRPGDLKFGEMQDYIVVIDNELARGNITKQDYCDKIDNLWDALKKDNPVLENVRLKENKNLLGRYKDRSDIYQKRQAVIGVDDGYNVSDLNFFLNKNSYMRDALNMAGAKGAEARTYQNFAVKVERMTETKNFGWRPSPDTLNFIHDKKLGQSPTTAPMHGGVEKKAVQPSSEKPVSGFSGPRPGGSGSKF